MAHLIGSIVKERPHLTVELLVYQESLIAAKSLKYVSKVHSIDRQKLITLKQSAIFSDSHAIDLLFETLKPLKDQTFDKVINYSNDVASTFLTSYLTSGGKAGNHVGVQFNEFKVTTLSSKWAMVFNDIITTFSNTPFHFIDCYHNMCDVKHSNNFERITTKEDHNQTAFDNFNLIRQNKSQYGEQVRIIGIQLKSSKADKDIPFDTIVELISRILQTPGLFPVLLIAPNKDEKQYVTNINEYFDNTLITVEADFTSVPSVLMNIDLLVTPDTVIKHIADLVDTPTVEVSLGSSPFLKQGTCTAGNLILTPIISCRQWFNRDDKELCKKIEKKLIENPISFSNDIFQCIKMLLNPEIKEAIELSPYLSLYKVSPDSLGVNFTHIAGSIDDNIEITRKMARLFIANLLESNANHQYDSVIHCHPLDTIRAWAQTEKEKIKNITKDLLNTLQNISVLRTDPSSKIRREFILNIDTLIGYCNHESLIAITAIIFRSKIESLHSNDFALNMQYIEKFIFTLKDDLKLLIKILNDLEEQVKVTEENISQITKGGLGNNTFA